MRTFHLTYLALFLIVPIAIAKPTRPNVLPKKEAVKVSPRQQSLEWMKQINGKVTNWGTMDLGGQSFELTGHAQWDAWATVREDGRIDVTWTLKSNGEICPGLYTVEPDGTLHGIWGQASEVQLVDGELVGRVRQDRIYLLPPEPDF